MKSYSLLVASIFTAAVTHSSQAVNGDYINNGSFESGSGSYLGWTTIGSAGINSTQFSAPTDGSFKAFISSGSGSVTASVLSTFFGGATLPGNTGGAAVEGSGIRQTFASAYPVSFSFDYKYVSQEDIHSGFDETFVYVDGNVSLLSDSDSPGLVTITGLPLRYKNGTAYRTVRIELAAGTHTIGFGSYDTGDASGDSAIIVDNVQAIPEPGTATLGVGLGLVGLLSRATRRRRARA